nr:agenet-like domain-containing protein [Tanacetum cinerariifolium]GEX88917.1 agenet-like domain-containing protein [Tanacetum cinerariifolium]
IDKQVEQSTPSVGKQSTVATSTMKRTKQTNLDNDDNNLAPSKKSKDETLLEDSSKRINDTSAGQSEGLDSEFGKTENLSHGKKVRGKRRKGIEQAPTLESSKKKGRLANEPKSLNVDEGAKDDSVKTTTQEIMEEDVTKDMALPVVMGLQLNETTVSQGKIIQKSSTEINPSVAEGETNELDVLSAPLTVVDKEGKEEDAASVTPRRKRGRPRKLQPIIPETPVTVNHQNGGVGPAEISVVEGAQVTEVSSPASPRTKSLEKNQEPVEEPNENPVKEPNEISVMEPNENPEQDASAQRGKKKYSSAKGGRRGKRRTISVNESLAQDTQDASKEKANGSLEAKSPETSVVQSVDTMDDQPLSTWIEGVHSPVTLNGPVGTSTSERRLEIVACDIDANISFVKTSPLWDMIESMEAFQKLPQNPHFRPLLKGVKESAREGFAIGTMVTFSNVVDRTFCLRFDYPRTAIEDSLETLVDLESNGFDVEVIRDRLTHLLLLKDKQEELEDRSKGVAEKIEEQQIREKTVDDELDELNKQIRQLEEKRRKVLLKKEKWALEIGAMKATEEAIEQELLEVAAEFDGAFYGARPSNNNNRSNNNNNRGNCNNSRGNNNNRGRGNGRQFDWASTQNTVYVTCNRCGIGHIPSQCHNRDPSTIRTQSSPNFANTRAQSSNASANWHTHTGANSHVTPHLKAMDNSEAYYGDDALHVGNDESTHTTLLTGPSKHDLYTITLPQRQPKKKKKAKKDLFTIYFNYDGIFTCSLLKYNQGHTKELNDTNFHDMSYEHLKEIALKSNQEIGDMLKVGYENGNVIDMYVEHFGDCEEIENVDFQTEGDESVVIKYISTSDPFLNKLCSARIMFRVMVHENDWKEVLVYCGRNVEEGRCAGKKGNKDRVMPNKVRSGVKKKVVKKQTVKKKVVKKQTVKKTTVLDFGEGTSQSTKWTKKQIQDSKKFVCPFGLSCAAFENGISESFNRAILIPRHKPIITMLEEIRLYIMQRLAAMNKVAFSLEDRITPNIRKRLEILKEKQREWTVFPSGFQEFEIRKGDHNYGVNLQHKVCQCRMWELSGVPCVHTMAAYLHVGKDLDLGVSHCRDGGTSSRGKERGRRGGGTTNSDGKKGGGRGSMGIGSTRGGGMAGSSSMGILTAEELDEEPFRECMKEQAREQAKIDAKQERLDKERREEQEREEMNDYFNPANWREDSMKEAPFNTKYAKVLIPSIHNQPTQQSGVWVKDTTDVTFEDISEAPAMTTSETTDVAEASVLEESPMDKGKGKESSADEASGTKRKRGRPPSHVDGIRIYHKNRGRSKRISNMKLKKPFQFDKHGTGSTPEKAFNVDD